MAGCLFCHSVFMRRAGPRGYQQHPFAVREEWRSRTQQFRFRRRAGGVNLSVWGVVFRGVGRGARLLVPRVHFPRTFVSEKTTADEHPMKTSRPYGAFSVIPLEWEPIRTRFGHGCGAEQKNCNRSIWSGGSFVPVVHCAPANVSLPRCPVRGREQRQCSVVS